MLQAQIIHKLSIKEKPKTSETNESHLLFSSDDEDVNSPEWKRQKKHVFILSESGKPVYSR